jgi:hypothetical protein
MNCRKFSVRRIALAITRPFSSSLVKVSGFLTVQMLRKSFGGVSGIWLKKGMAAVTNPDLRNLFKFIILIPDTSRITAIHKSASCGAFPTIREFTPEKRHNLCWKIPELSARKVDQVASESRRD